VREWPGTCHSGCKSTRWHELMHGTRWSDSTDAVMEHSLSNLLMQLMFHFLAVLPVMSVCRHVNSEGHGYPKGA